MSLERPTEIPAGVPVGATELSAEAAAPGVVLPSAEVFLPDEAGHPSFGDRPDDQAPDGLPGRPGPGVLESGAWTLGVFIAQIIASIGAVILVLMSRIAIHGPGGLDARGIEALFNSQFIWVTMISGSAVVLYGLIGVAFRQAPGGLARLGWQCPAARHVLLILLAFLPLSLLCSELSAIIIEYFPGSDWGMGEMIGMMAQSPFPIFLVAIAVLPAIGEELVFRGLIGRGLVARWGVLWGMLITSALFGLVHVIPAQALAVIPLGFAMHLAYYTTRSFWAPVLVHFLNNAWAAFLMKYSASLPEGALRSLAVEEHVPPVILLGAFWTALAIGGLLWQTRVRYRLADGTLWDPGYPTAAPPPGTDSAKAERRAASGSMVVAAAMGLAILGVALSRYLITG